MLIYTQSVIVISKCFKIYAGKFEDLDDCQRNCWKQYDYDEDSLECKEGYPGKYESLKDCLDENDTESNLLYYISLILLFFVLGYIFYRNQ